jgi:translation initiation factor IF-3
MSHIEVGQEVMDNFIAQVEEFATVEKKSYLEGRFLNAILASKVKK